MTLSDVMIFTKQNTYLPVVVKVKVTYLLKITVGLQDVSMVTIAEIGFYSY